MFTSFFRADWQKATKKLSRLNINKDQPHHYIQFRQVFMLIMNQIIPQKSLKVYLKAMIKTALSPQTIIKCLIMLHVYLQEVTTIEEEVVMEFLAGLLPRCHDLQQKYSKLEAKSQSKLDKSTCSKSTCSEDYLLCKQNYLLKHIVRPYISYLMKKVVTFVQFKQLLAKDKGLDKHEAWQIINLLKSISNIATNFIHVGRYWLREYGGVVVLLSKVLGKQVNRYYNKLQRYVAGLTQLVVAVRQDKQMGELVNMLEEISILNDSLLILYLNKYFYQYLSLIPEPRWINNTSPEFDKLFLCWKSRRSNQTIRLVSI